MTFKSGWYRIDICCKFGHFNIKFFRDWLAFEWPFEELFFIFHHSEFVSWPWLTRNLKLQGVRMILFSMHEYILPFSETKLLKKNNKRKYGVKMKQISKWGKKQNMCKKQFETEQKLQPSARQTYELLHNSHKFSLLMWTYCSFLQHSHSYTTEVIWKMCIVLLFSQKL